MNTINSTGIAEIREFLAANHKRGDIFTPSMLHAWAEDAEFQLGEGNPPTIELKSYESVSGHAVTYTISDAGITKNQTPE